MDIRDLISSNTILDYIYSFGLVFCICIIGSFLKDCRDSIKKLGKINIVRVIVSSCFAAFVLCFIFSYIEISFAAFVFICFMTGIWSSYLMDAMFNIKIVLIVLKNVFKQISNPLSKGISDAIQEVQDEEDDKKKKEKPPDKNNETKDDS